MMFVVVVLLLVVDDVFAVAVAVAVGSGAQKWRESSSLTTLPRLVNHYQPPIPILPIDILSH